MYLSNKDTILTEENGEFPENLDSETNSVFELAADTLKAFHPYINRLDCGKKLWDQKEGKFVPKHLITQESCKFASIRQNLPYEERKAYKPVFEKDSKKGRPFHYWAHYLNRRMSAEKIAEHIRGEETYYYTSSRQRRAIPYFDVDAHDGQEDELEAKELLHNIFSCSLWNGSNRGQNGYFKLYYGSVQKPDLSHPAFQELSDDALAALRERIRNGLTAKQANELFDRAQEAYRRYLEFHNIACTFEIKGKVTEYDYTTKPIQVKSGSLAKFPFTGWTRDRLEEFTNMREINWYVWERQIQLLEKMLDEKEASVAPTVTESSATKNVSKPTRKKRKTSTDPESCAFTRNGKEVLPFVRKFYRKHERVPSHHDFLNHLRLENLFSGQWDDPESDRFSRTARVLDFTLQTFDPNQLGKGEGRWGDFPVLIWLQDYARDHFGSMTGTTVKGKDKLIFGEDGLPKSGTRNQHCNVTAEFARHCIWVILTCMEDLPDNDGLPEDRIVKAWSLLPNAPAWNRDHYAIVRDHLEKRGIIDIYDKNHGPNKCWRWTKGKNYPHSPEQLKKKLEKLTAGSSFFSTKQRHTQKITPYCKVIGIVTSSWLLNNRKGRSPPPKTT